MAPGGAGSTVKKDELPRPRILEGRDIPSVAKYVKSDQCKNIVFMLGAGVSTAAGIPDFRSPETGLYANLAHLGLPYPEAVFDIQYFRRNPKPFYALAHDLQPGKFRPTLTHSFVRLIHEKGLLLTCFTQNIDTLERRAGIPEFKLVEAHGSFASHHCIDCHASYDHESVMNAIEEKKIPKCQKCHGLVKPDIVFFGEQLPYKFFQSMGDVKKADLLIIVGTSLTVHPFASLATTTKDNCPRVLINLEQVGNLGHKLDDVLLLGQCDEVVEKLSKELGWHDELMELWQPKRPAEVEETKSAKDEVEKLAEQISKQMKLEEGEATKKVPKPDTNPADPSKPRIRSDDEAKSKSEHEHATSEEVPAGDKKVDKVDTKATEPGKL